MYNKICVNFDKPITHIFFYAIIKKMYVDV